MWMWNSLSRGSPASEDSWKMDTGASMFCHNNWCAIKIARQRCLLVLELCWAESRYIRSTKIIMIMLSNIEICGFLKNVIHKTGHFHSLLCYVYTNSISASSSTPYCVLWSSNSRANASIYVWWKSSTIPSTGSVILGTWMGAPTEIKDSWHNDVYIQLFCSILIQNSAQMVLIKVDHSTLLLQCGIAWCIRPFLWVHVMNL